MDSVDRINGLRRLALRDIIDRKDAFTEAKATRDESPGDPDLEKAFVIFVMCVVMGAPE
jgi:hypothetical protein